MWYLTTRGKKECSKIPSISRERTFYLKQPKNQVCTWVLSENHLKIYFLTNIHIKKLFQLVCKSHSFQETPILLNLDKYLLRYGHFCDLRNAQKWASRNLSIEFAYLLCTGQKWVPPGKLPFLSRLNIFEHSFFPLVVRYQHYLHTKIQENIF